MDYQHQASINLFTARVIINPISSLQSKSFCYYSYLIKIQMRSILTFTNLFRNSAKITPHKQWGLSDDYEVLYPLGKGSSAKVFQGVNVLSGKKVVIKIFKNLPAASIYKEIQINNKILNNLKSQEHKKVKFIELIDTLYDPSSSAFTLVYQFYHGVTLNELIATIQYPQTLKIILTMAHTLKYIHSMGIVHRDIKPANILVTPNGARLFDFGLAKMINEANQIKTNNFGTKCYKCPQVVYRMDTYNHSADIWCLGLIFAQLALNKRHILKYQSDALMLDQISSFCPLKDQDKSLFSQQLIKNITVSRGKSWRRLAEQKNLQKPLIDLIERMLLVNPKKRPCLQQIIGNPIFKGVDLQQS